MEHRFHETNARVYLKDNDLIMYEISYKSGKLNQFIFVSLISFKESKYKEINYATWGYLKGGSSETAVTDPSGSIVNFTARVVTWLNNKTE